MVLPELADSTRLDRWVVGALGLLLAASIVICMDGLYGGAFDLGVVLAVTLQAALLGRTAHHVLLRVVDLMSMIT